MSVYYASKGFFVLFFTEASADELRGSGVTVTALCPGPTAADLPAPRPFGEYSPDEIELNEPDDRERR